ncbi:MAG: Cof-type HAD-IIB family hydrolase [Pseudomonadales bacterium]|nr:Cof-type HAD-IIB family hydrolase [Pseudomonadales bacterium]
MAYRAFAIDLDGTLLVGEHVPEDNITALRMAHAAGFQIMIATARWVQMAQRVEAEIGIRGLVIACSGAQVHDPVSGVDVFDERLPADFADALFTLCDEERCIATVTVSDRVLVKLDGEPDPSQMPEEMHWVPKLSGAAQSLPRVAVIQGSAANERIRRELKEKFQDRVLFVNSIGPTGKTLLTLTSKKGSKGDALRAACTHLGITPAQVIAFGDSENDLEMFRAAGASVAMGQADEHTKSVATHVTARNDEAGVARAVERILATGAP